MDQNTRNFLDFWNSYTWPTVEPVFFRLYHDDNGYPVCYSMQDLAGSYIDITAEQYAQNNYRVRIKHGKLVPHITTRTSKLIPTSSGIPCDPNDITIVVTAESCQKWKLKTYDHN